MSISEFVRRPVPLGLRRPRGSVTAVRAAPAAVPGGVPVLRLACNLTAITSFIGLTAAVAVKGTWGWPFLVTLLISGYGYLFGLGTYSIAEEGTPDDADTGRQARPPVSS